MGFRRPFVRRALEEGDCRDVKQCVAWMKSHEDVGAPSIREQREKEARNDIILEVATTLIEMVEARWLLNEETVEEVAPGFMLTVSEPAFVEEILDRATKQGYEQLGDMVADVIKIESPDGNYTRQVGPSRNPKMGALFLNTNRNKRSVVLDLKKPDARAALLDLVRSADVLVHSIRPGAAERRAGPGAAARRPFWLFSRPPFCPGPCSEF